MSHKSTTGREKRRWFVGLVQTMRPHQWVKNLLVLAPLFFSQAFFDWEAVVRGVAAGVGFCLMAGTVYLINDIADRERDRRHPTKRNRPIASGELSIPIARWSAGATGAMSLAIAAVLDWRLVAVLASYLVMNLAYSSVLKQWAFVDVGIIAVGFVLRIVAGSLAVGVFLSEWLVLCTFLLACFLGLGKRCHELLVCRAGKLQDLRRGWKDYRPEHLEAALFFVGGLTVAAYTIYALTASLPDQPLRTRHTPFTNPLLPVTIPLVVVGLARFYQLVGQLSPVSPTDRMLRDPVVWTTVILWLLVLLGLGSDII